jgi:CubicO group peptidase (beta-lactamase class C family)
MKRGHISISKATATVSRVSVFISNISRLRPLTIAWLGLALFAAACQPPDITACDPQGCISEASFRNNIVNAVSGQVVGYVVTVGELAPAFGGFARTSADPPSNTLTSLAMLPTESINVASVSKTLTAIGVLQSLTKHGISIDSSISPYIYTDWVQGNYINTITFNDLLTHRSGFPGNNSGVCGGDDTMYSVLKSIIANGVSETHETDNGGNGNYSNCNFAMFRELLFIMEGNSINGFPDGPQRAQASANFYVNYMNQHVFSPVGVQAVTCAPNPDPSFAALSYPFPPGNDPGWNGAQANTPTGDWTLSCGGGGWNVSAGDLFLVLNDIASGNVLLTPAEKALMSSSSNHFPGWDNAVRSDCPSPQALCKNGSISGNVGSNPSASIWTYLGVFKCNVPVVVVVNSALNQDVIDVVENAYNSLPQSGPPQPCTAGSLIASGG